MKIGELKESLDIEAVAESIGIEIDQKTKRAKCPFHNDRTPSLQFSKEKQIATCFSSKCDAGTMDVINLVEKKLKLSTHKAIEYLKSENPNLQTTKQTATKEAKNQTKEEPNYQKDFEKMQSSLLNSSIARKYLESRAIESKSLELGYNAFKESKFKYLRGCISFPLKDKDGKIISMYGRSVRDNDKAKHYYTANRKGLYPSYPKAETKKLILTESVVDTATLLQNEEITKHYNLLALYGTNGYTAEHKEAIKELKNLEEIILFFDGDQAGKKAEKKWAEEIQKDNPKLKITGIETLENEDINSIAVAHEKEIFIELLKNRKPFLFQEKTEEKASQEKLKANSQELTAKNLNTENPNNISYQTETANYSIKGGIRRDLDSLKVTLVISRIDGSWAKSRNKLDLYEDKQTEKIARESGEKLDLRADLIERDLGILTDLLDEYREQNKDKEENKTKETKLTAEEKAKALKFLKQKALIKRIGELIGKSGVVGEENNRIFLYVIASSYKMENTLHALIQGSSGSGKTHLLASIMNFIPIEKTISLTRVTESSFYNYGEYELQNKLIGIEDRDGLEEKAELAFRELQSKGMISSSTSGKNEHTGRIAAYIKKVYGPIASLSATTKGAIYEDNMSRSFLVAVDESIEQTSRIIQYQNNKSAGKIDKVKEKEIRTFLRNCTSLLKNYEVINPYANKIELPREAHKIRRLNDLFQSFIKQVSLVNQYQRKRDQKGRIITEKEDLKIAIEIMFESIILKVDELDGSLRSFYEKLKKYVLEKGKNYEFTRLEVRKALKVSKTGQHNYMSQLLDLEYIYQIGGYINKGFKYKINYWDDNGKLRTEIKTKLNEQLNKL